MALTIQERMKDLRVEHGLTLEQLAEQTGLSKSALGSYESVDFKDISHYAILKLSSFYGVTADYLLGLSEMKQNPNADLNDLNLSDRMIKLLKAGQFNTTLLCELATHRDFVKLMADIEIYVNGMAASQIQSLNILVDVARTEIMNKYQPGEYDYTAYLLKALHIQEGDYFNQRIHDDIDLIIADIKEAHRGRNKTAPENPSAAELMRTFEEVEHFHGSRTEKFLMLFCKQTKINYSNLTEEEKQCLIRIAKKSKLVKSAIPQRGKGVQ